MLKFEDELTSWIEGMGMYKNNSGVEKEFWVKNFNPAKDYEKNRVSNSILFVVPEATRLILPNYHYEMKEEVIKPY